MKNSITKLAKTLPFVLVSSVANADLVYVHYEGTITKRYANQITPTSSNTLLNTIELLPNGDSIGSTVSGTIIISPEHKAAPYEETETNFFLGSQTTTYENMPNPDGESINYKVFPSRAEVRHNSFVTSSISGDSDTSGFDSVFIRNSSESGGTDWFSVSDSLSIHHNPTTKTKTGPLSASIKLSFGGSENFLDSIDLEQNFSLNAEQLSTTHSGTGRITYSGHRHLVPQYVRNPTNHWGVDFELTSVVVETAEGASLEEPAVCY